MTKPTDSPSSPALDATLATPPVGAASAARPPAAGMRSTVLPRVERSGGVDRVVVEGRPRYQEVRPLGAGGQAQVTLTRDHDIDRVVALKRLLPHNLDEASVLRFTEEIRTVGRLEHPNIVPIHDVGVDEQGQYFFVMKYLEGETLETIIEKLRAGEEASLARYSLESRLQICNEILRAVEHAHQLGVLHRDLKPANIMVGALGEVVVMDWGLAKGGEARGDEHHAAAAPDRLFQTQTGSLLGTPAYMSPEQAAGREVDARSDVYSLAVMFYELLTLRHPRRHLTTVAEMIASLTGEPVSESLIISDFSRARAPAALAHFVRHGLSRDPAKRYASVAAMRERLELVRERRAPVECSITFVQKVFSTASRSADRYPIVLGLALLLLVAGALAALIVLLR